jgi:hypothetical protein
MPTNGDDLGMSAGLNIFSLSLIWKLSLYQGTTT